MTMNNFRRATPALGKTQINLFFLSLIRTFAPENVSLTLYIYI